MKNAAPATPAFKIVVTTLFGLEAELAEELRNLGARDIVVKNRAVECSGNQKLMYEINIRCHTAVRVLKVIRTFRVRDERMLYKQIRSINWSEFLDVSASLAIDTVVNQSVFNNSLYVAQLTKDAIADQFREQTGERPSVDLVNPDLRINLHMYENFVTLSLDSSGDSLHKRGYRLQTNVAPINEALAAGIVRLTGWDKKSPFVDPMCGSGTLLIEAALLAHNIAPGLFRDEYGFMFWKDFDPELYITVRREAKDMEKINPEVIIQGSDIEEEYIAAARKNIANAGLEKWIKLEVKNMRDVEAPGEEGVVVLNPPYGERIGNEASINELYKLIGDTLKTNFNGYEAFVFTGNLEAAKHIGLRTSRRIQLYNGPIECRLLKFELYKGSRKQKAE